MAQRGYPYYAHDEQGFWDDDAYDIHWAIRFLAVVVIFPALWGWERVRTCTQYDPKPPAKW
jgi:hypothetical protein